MYGGDGGIRSQLSTLPSQSLGRYPGSRPRLLLGIRCALLHLAQITLFRMQ